MGRELLRRRGAGVGCGREEPVEPTDAREGHSPGFNVQPQQRVGTHRVARWSGAGVGRDDRSRGGQADQASGGSSGEPAGSRGVHERWQVDPDRLAGRRPE